MRALKRLAKLFGWLVLGVLALVLGVAAELALLTRTENGRSQLARLSEGLTDDLLVGQLRIGEVERLDPFGAVLRDVVLRDTRGAVVARIERLGVALDPQALGAGRIHLTQASIDGGFADLRALDATDHGLLAAVALREPGPDTPDDPNAEPLWLDVDHVRVSGVHVQGEVPDLGEANVRGLALEGAFHMRGTMLAELSQLSARVQLGEGPVLALGPVRGSYRDDGKPSRIELHAQGQGGAAPKLNVKAEAVVPPHPSADTAPLHAELALSGLDQAWLVALGVDDPALGTPLGAHVTLNGTVQALSAAVRLDSPGGTLDIDATLDELDRLALDLDTSGLALQRAYASAPANRVTASLTLSTKLSGLPDTVPLELRIKRASLDGDPLPTVRLDAELRERVLHIARLDAAGHGLQARIWGSYALDSQRVDAEGKVEGSALQYAGLRVGSVNADVSAHGPLPFPQASVALNAREVVFGEQRIDALGVHVEGGPTNYAVRVQAQAPDARVALEGSVRRTERLIEVSVQADGRFREHPFELDVRGLRVENSGRLSVPHLTATALGQHVQLSGERSARGALTLSLRAEHIDLALLASTLELPQPLQGTLDVTLNAEGTVEEPRIELSLSGQGVGLPAREDKPAFAVQTVAEVHYEPGEASLLLRADDARGAWLSVSAGVQPEARKLKALIASAPHLLHEARWQVEATVAERAVSEFAAFVELPAELREARFDLDLHAEHAARSEPEVELGAHLKFPAYGEASERCHPPETALTLDARLLKGRLTLAARGQAAAREMLELSAETELALSQTLRTFEPPKPHAVGYTLAFGDVELGQLPLACAFAYGTLGIDSRGEDLLGNYPRVEATLRGTRFGLSANERLDFELGAKLGGEGLQATGELVHDAHTSRLSAKLPLHLKQLAVELRRDAPLEASLTLDALPLSPFATPGLPVSRVHGTLSGVVRAGGTLNAPELDGQLKLVKARFTANSLAQPLRDVGGTFDFTERHVTIKKLCAHDRGGEVCVSGRVELPREEKAEAKLEVVVDDFPLRQQGQVVADASLTASVDARMLKERTEVKLHLRDVDMWLRGGDRRAGQSLEPHPDILDPRAAADRDAEAEQEEPDAPPTKVRIVLDASEGFWVKRDDFAVKLSTQLELVVEPDGVRVVGVVLIDRGYLQLFGETFDIDRKSTLEFVGGSAPDPVLDIGARAKSKKSGQIVAVRITGRASEPKVEFMVDDVVGTAGDAVRAIMGGESSGDEEQSAAGQAQSFAAGVMASMMAVAARRELGAAAPIIMLEPGEDVRSSRVRAGFELDDLVPKVMQSFVRGVYVEGIVAGDQGKSAVQGGVLLELYFPYSLVWAGQYGPGETWSLDFGWEP